MKPEASNKLKAAGKAIMANTRMKKDAGVDVEWVECWADDHGAHYVR